MGHDPPGLQTRLLHPRSGRHGDLPAEMAHGRVLRIGALPAFLKTYIDRPNFSFTDYLRGDVAVKGGISALVKAAHLAEAFHMNYEVHHGGNSLNNVANLHVIMAIKNCEFFEVLLPAGAQKYGLAQDIEVDPHGLVHAFEGAGLGAAIDFQLIERKKTAVLS